jgi:hypothetical protein
MRLVLPPSEAPQALKALSGYRNRVRGFRRCSALLRALWGGATASFADVSDYAGRAGIALVVMPERAASVI